MLTWDVYMIKKLEEYNSSSLKLGTQKDWCLGSDLFVLDWGFEDECLWSALVFLSALEKPLRKLILPLEFEHLAIREAYCHLRPFSF